MHPHNRITVRIAAHIELITIGLAALSVIPGAFAYWHSRRARADVLV